MAKISQNPYEGLVKIRPINPTSINLPYPTKSQKTNPEDSPHVNASTLFLSFSISSNNAREFVSPKKLFLFRLPALILQ